MLNRTVGWVLSAALVLFGAAGLPEYAKADSGNMYSSRDAWYAPADGTTENTYNSHTEWKWERKDSGRDWFDFAAFKKDNKNVFGSIPPNVTGEDRVKGDAWTTAGGSWNHPAVGEGWMMPYMLTGHPDYAVSRTFTAPRSGRVELSTEDGNLYGGSNQPGVKNNRTAFVRITVNDEQIWPDGSGGMRIPETDGQTYKFGKITTEIAEGDKLRFEVYNGDSDSQNGKAVYWIPTVKYVYGGRIDLFPDLHDDVPAGQVFTLNFSDAMEEITAEDIKISPLDGVAVKDVSNSDDGASLSFGFDGLKGNTQYKVSIDGIRPLAGGYDAFSYSFEFTTEKIFEYPIYDSDDAWGDMSEAGMKNDDEHWQWLYKNNSTKDTLTPYVPYTLTEISQTQSYSKPAQNEDGGYDYAAMLSPSGSAENRTRVYCDAKSNAYARNVMGRWWMRPAVATQSEPAQSKDNEIVKAFTAKETGVIRISARDLTGRAKIYNRKFSEANLNGAVLRIIKKGLDNTDEELWTHTFKYTAATLPEEGLAEYDFEPISTDIQKGEQLWFVVSGELGGSAYSKQVFWNPVVEYTSLYPNITNMTPEDKASGVALNFEQRISFDYPIRCIGLSDIEVDKGAAAASVGLEDGNTTLCISYSGLKQDTEYRVKLHNVIIDKAHDNSSRVYEFSFVTGSAVQVGEIYILNGQLSAGENTVCAEVNNASSEAVEAALLVCVCKGTKTDYEIISAGTVYRSDISENDLLSVTVDLPESENHFLKAVLLNNVSSAIALTPIKIFGQ